MQRNCLYTVSIFVAYLIGSTGATFSRCSIDKDKWTLNIQLVCLKLCLEKEVRRLEMSLLLYGDALLRIFSMQLLKLKIPNKNQRSIKS